MNKQAIFDFIKKNLLSLLCGLVAIFAIVATFYPIGGWFGDLALAANQRAGNDQALGSFTRVRKMPVTDPSKSDADAAELTMFPNHALVVAGTDIDTKLITQSKDAFAFVKDLSAAGHVLLVPNVLPDAQSQTTALNFAEVYTRVLSSDPAMSGDPAATPPPDPRLVTFKALNLQNDLLHGVMPPSQKDIDDARAALYHNVFEPRIYLKNGQPVNDVEVKQDFAAASAKLPQQLKAEIAKKKKIYVERTAFELNPNISVTQAPYPVDVWYAQNSLWIQTDIAHAIADANAQATNVLDAPVKHLISLRIDPSLYTFPPSAAGTAAGGIGTGPLPANETQPLPPIYTASPTGRVSNGMYDVVHFTLLIDVDASRVNDVIQSFSKGRFISIYRQDLYSVDSAHEESLGYLYGKSRVIRLNLDGEFLFLRSWTTPWMPDKIKIALGLLANPGGPAGGGMPPGGYGGIPGSYGMPPGMSPNGISGGGPPSEPQIGVPLH